MNLISTTRRKLTLAATAAALVTGALAAPAANAALLGGPLPGGHAGATAPVATGACDNAALSQPFLPWGDDAQYKVVPGGTFEGPLPPGWALNGGARVVADPTARGGHAVSLPQGASLQTPFTCVNMSYPTLRTLVSGPKGQSNVSVDVIYRERTGNMKTLPAGTFSPKGGWAPSPLLSTNSIIAGLHTVDGNASIALRFTASQGNASIDDVYIDPRMR